MFPRPHRIPMPHEPGGMYRLPCGCSTHGPGPAGIIPGFKNPACSLHNWSPAPERGNIILNGLDAKITALRFFESGWDPPGKTDRRYSAVFLKQAARFINWELNLTHSPLVERVSFEVEAIYIAPGGTEFGRHTKQIVLEEGWTRSWYARGRGYHEPGNWSIGSYRVELFVKQRLVVSGNFKVID